MNPHETQPRAPGVTQTEGLLFPIIQWVHENGEVKATDRLFVLCLSAMFAEGILAPDMITPETTVSESCLLRFRETASTLVGEPCPH